MKHPYGIGLDIGIASVGWAVVALNEKRLQDLEQELKKEKEKNEEKTDHHRM